MVPGRLPGPALADDPRVATARALLAAYNSRQVPPSMAGAELGGDWTLRPWTMRGHLGGVLRLLLEAVDEAAQGGARDE